MIEEAPHPLSRMASVDRISFWIFLGACILLYIYNKLSTQDNDVGKSYGLNNLLIFITAFTGLLLNLIAAAIKKTNANRILNIICYGFEITSVVLLGLMIALK